MIRLSTLLCGAMLAVNSGLAAHAQDSDVTPRQTFTAFAADTPVEDLRFKPFVVKPAAPTFESTAKPTAPGIPPQKKSASTLPASPRAQAPKAAAAATLLPPAPPIESARPVNPRKLSLTPFYVSAADYLKARGRVRHAQVKLSYAVTVTNPESGVKAKPKTAELIIGPNYAAITQSGKTRIFDFKMNRLLTVTTEDQGPVFQNVSLYPSTYKNIQTVNNATQNGALTSIALSPNVSLDAFWLEASMGWTPRQNIDGLTVTRNGKNISSTYKSESPLIMDLSGPELPSESHMRALYAYWLHDVPIHPAILPQMGRPDHAPKSMTLLSYGPKYIKGLRSFWVLKNSENIRGPFPLPKGAINSASLNTASPLAQAISQHAAGKAVQGRPSQKELRSKIKSAQKNGDIFEAWTAAQILSHRLGGCEKDSGALCSDIKSIEAKAGSDSHVARLSAIIKKAESQTRRSQGFEDLLPFISDGSAPAFLVKIAGQARSKLTNKALTDPALSVIRADTLLEQALIKEPEDPETYVTLAQVYAAQGRFEESWDIQDSLRLLPTASKKLTAPINHAEKTLNRIAPGFFVAKGP